MGTEVSPEDLAKVSLFADLRQEQQLVLSPLLARSSWPAGHTVFHAGEPAEAVYIVEDGEVAIRYHPDDGDWLTIATVRRGEVFGWSAALGRSRYTSSAVCQTGVQALVIRGAELRAAIRANPELGVLLGRMAVTVAGRQPGARAQVAQLIRNEVRRTEDHTGSQH
jgi:CRP-like cAMP-binding protein